MTGDADTILDVSKELTEAHARLPIDISNSQMPLDMTIRSIALTIAQRHCGDTVIQEGNLYQQLKMDGKITGPLTVNHVLHCALVFEAYLWGNWSKDIAGKALEKTLDELDEVIKSKEFNEHIDETIGEQQPESYSQKRRRKRAERAKQAEEDTGGG